MNATVDLSAHELETLADHEAEFARALRRPVSAPPTGFPAVVTAVLHGFDVIERALVSGIAAMPGQVVVACSMVSLRREMIGATVALGFVEGDPRQPLILGVITSTPFAPSSSVTARIDGEERIVLRADREIVLQCGESSITLTRAGKVLIKGNYVLSQSRGCNKIKGASVDIN
jgi:hypothetical protein